MGAIKDVVDLLSQLSNGLKDRKLAAELASIQSLVLKIQAEQAELHESNIQLREEKLAYRERIQVLEAKIAEMELASSRVNSDAPCCPNCSTSSKPYYMSPLGDQFRMVFGATHECPQCHHKLTSKK